MLKYHIQTIELSSNAAVLDFDAIPQDYDDLELVISIRLTVNDANFRIRFNRNSSGVYNERILYGNGSSASSFGRSNADAYNYVYSVKSTETANTFSSHKLLVSNYTSSTAAKSTSIDGVTENNATAAVQYLHAGLFNSTAPVTSLQVFYNLGAGEVAQYSSASLYGIKRGVDGVTLPVASGGTVTTSGGYTYHTFTSSSTFVANRDLQTDVLVVAGGGSGGATQTSSQRGSGGGGAGGYLAQSLSVSIGSYPIVVGAGGAGVAALQGRNGADSSAFTITALGGGGGGGGPNSSTISGLSGGSGGGGYSENNGVALGGSNATGQGFSGQAGYYSSSSDFFGGGGGGAGEAGGTDQGGDGGDGLQWVNGTYYAGGGAGATYTSYSALGGLGGGANGPRGTGAVSGSAGTPNTGGGGSGALSVSEATSQTGGSGGSGVVIIRYLTPAS